MTATFLCLLVLAKSALSRQAGGVSKIDGQYDFPKLTYYSYVSLISLYSILIIFAVLSCIALSSYYFSQKYPPTLPTLGDENHDAAYLIPRKNSESASK